MKATITLHKEPSIIEKAINLIFFGCKTEYVVPKPEPKPDPYEGMSDKEIIARLKQENARLRNELIDAEYGEEILYRSLWVLSQIKNTH